MNDQEFKAYVDGLNLDPSHPRYQQTIAALEKGKRWPHWDEVKYFFLAAELILTALFSYLVFLERSHRTRLIVFAVIASLFWWTLLLQKIYIFVRFTLPYLLRRKRSPTRGCTDN